MAVSTEPNLLLLYGSLRRGEPMFRELGLTEALKFLGDVGFQGVLYDLGDYPGVIPGKGVVSGELHEIRDPAILTALDEYEEFDPLRPENSLFVRRTVLVPGKGEAWVYFYNHAPAIDHHRIDSGDWRKRRSAA